MTVQLPTWYVTQWRQTTIHKYQRQGFRLRETVMPPHDVKGEKLIFRLMDRMQAERDVGRGEKVKENSPALSKVELSTKKTRLAFFVDEDDLDLTDLGPGVISSHGEAGANEMGRVHDDIIIAEMDNVAATYDVGSYAAPISPAELMLAKQRLHANHINVQDGQVFAAIDSVSWNVCMDFKQFANSDWMGPNLPFVTGGMAKTWNGVNIFVPDDEIFPLANTTEMNCFMWHKSAFGFGSLYNPPMRASGAWDESRSGWLHTLRHRYGAKVIQEPGIIRMLTDYDTAHIVATK